MIVEIAVATHTHPGPWWQEEPETIATVLEILEQQAAASTGKGRRRRGGP